MATRTDDTGLSEAEWLAGPTSDQSLGKAYFKMGPPLSYAIIKLKHSAGVTNCGFSVCPKPGQLWKPDNSIGVLASTIKHASCVPQHPRLLLGN